MKWVDIKIPMYHTRFIFCVGEFDVKNFQKTLNKKDKYFKTVNFEASCENMEKFDGSQWDFDGTIVIHVEDAGVSKVSHEILHGVFDVASRIGINYNRESEEFYTYMLGYVMKEFYNAYDKIKD